MKWLDKLKRMRSSAARNPPVDNEPVMSGEPYEPQPEISTPVHAGLAEAASSAESQAVSKLSPRETEVFQRLLTGAKMREIAGELGVKTSTVNGYCTQIYKLLGVNSRAQLILRYSSCQDSKVQEGDE